MVADLSKFAGSYTEFIRWWDASGRSGGLQGSVVVWVEADQINLRMDDGHSMTGKLSPTAEPIRLAGSGGGATSRGLLYFGEEALILEYDADVRGRVERTVDAWTFNGGDGTVMRAGLIQRDEVTIWFEGRMLRE